MKLCDNSIILVIFIIIKIFIYFIFPFIIYKKKDIEIAKYFIATEIILLVCLLICNFFNINKCIYNSNLSGIKKSMIKHRIINYNENHYNIDEYNSVDKIEPQKFYSTYKGRKFYYYNQNNDFLKNRSLSCDESKYFNKYGAPVTATAMSVSTVLNTNINPIKLLNLLDNEYYDCENKIDISDVFNVAAKRYGGLVFTEITANDVANSIVNDGIVIANINANGQSKLTCGENYIVLYNVNLNGKISIADPDDSDSNFICSKSSPSYGVTLSANRTNSEWSMDELNSVATHYYLVRRAN